MIEGKILRSKLFTYINVKSQIFVNMTMKPKLDVFGNKNKSKNKHFNIKEFVLYE